MVFFIVLFFSHVSPALRFLQDLPKAFGYFQQASSYGTDGDSLFNAAYCLANGLGTPVDHGRAVQLYEQAAYQFGHFDAIYGKN